MIITIAIGSYCYLILNVDCKRSLQGHEVTLLASQYIRAGETLLLGGRWGLPVLVQITFPSSQCGRKMRFSPGRISSGKSWVPPLYFWRNTNECEVPEWFRELHSAAFQRCLGSSRARAWHRTRWRPKCLGHVGHLHLSWILSSPGHLLLGPVGGRGSQFLPADTAGKGGTQCRHLGLWSLAPPQLLWPMLFWILQNRTNSHKSFAEQINPALQPSQGEKESFKQLGRATQWFSSKPGRQLRGAPKAAMLLRPLLRGRQHQHGCCSQGSSHDGGQGGGTVGPHTVFKERKGLTFLILARSSRLLKRHWPVAKCVFPGLLQ